MLRCCLDAARKGWQSGTRLKPDWHTSAGEHVLHIDHVWYGYLCARAPQAGCRRAQKLMSSTESVPHTTCRTPNKGPTNDLSWTWTRLQTSAWRILHTRYFALWLVIAKLLGQKGLGFNLNPVQDMDLLFSIDQKAMALVLARHDPECQTLIKPEDVPIFVEVLGGDLKQAYVKAEKKYLELLSAAKSD